MGTGQKVVVVVLVLLVGGFAAAVVLQQHGDGSTAPYQGSKGYDWITALHGRWFENAADVDPGDLRADCLTPDGDRLVVEGACTLWVASSQTRLRLVRLHAVTAISVSSRLPESEAVVDDDVSDDSDVTVAVDAKQTAIALTCGSTSPCVLTLAGED